MRIAILLTALIVSGASLASAQGCGGGALLTPCADGTIANSLKGNALLDGPPQATSDSDLSATSGYETRRNGITGGLQPDGATQRQIGTTTYLSNGKTCKTVGNLLVCN